MNAAEGARWRRIERALDAALEREGDARRTYLDRLAASSPMLHREVDRLLAAAAAAGDFLERPVDQHAAPLLAELARREEAEEAAALVGQTIGPYRLLEEIGRGGMGTVFLAERADGAFEQRLALKLVKRGMDSDAIVRRFVAERQILARLEHPNIARLLDGGVSDDGRPYFAMERVVGRPITAYCDARRLSIERRLAIFVQVCEAVRYAHRNLVVHRDLKPSNILVTAEGVVKLLDFGIAKLLAPGLEDGPLTETRNQAMTPEFAAPEQLAGRPLTTAADVYSLGIVLYELLTGRRPERPVAGDAGASATVQRPSVAVGRPPGVASPAASPEARCRDRGTSCARLRRRLAGDLDTIVLKALQPEPERRYPSAEALLQDLERHRRGRPITARPDTFAYRARKFTRRHRWAVLATAAASFAIVGGAVTAAWQARVASRERARERAVRDFVVDLFGLWDPEELHGKEVSVRGLLERGASRLDSELAGEPEVRAEIIAVVADLCGKLGMYERAGPLLEQSLALRRELYGAESPEVAEATRRLAEHHLVTGDLPRAEELSGASLATARRLLGDGDPELARFLDTAARVLQEERRYDGAEALYRSAVEVREAALGDQHPEVATGLAELGSFLTQRGAYEEAEPLLRRSLEIRRLLGIEEDVAASLRGLACVFEQTGRVRAAEPLYREIVDRRTSAGGPAATTADLDDLARVLFSQGKYSEAEPLFAAALARRRAVLEAPHPELAENLYQLGGVRLHLGDAAGAEPLLRENVEMGRRLYGGEHPELANGLAYLAAALTELGSYAEAERLLGEALDLYHAQGLDDHVWRGGALMVLGRLLERTGRSAEAVAVLREALAIRRGSYGEEHCQTAPAAALLGAALLADGRTPEAEELIRSSHRTLTSECGEGGLGARWARDALAALEASRTPGAASRPAP